MAEAREPGTGIVHRQTDGLPEALDGAAQTS